MSEQRLNQIEKMLSTLISTVGTMKAYMEEDREYHQQRFEQIDKRCEQIDKRFEQMDKRFDEVLAELRENKKEHQYMAARIFQNEMDIQKMKLAFFDR